ncbi:HPr-rel-A system PqqD family peptide chaperone [uncultured Sphingosinicella sp.]|jgi:PqqD family protein of HPr-rel-A system|uniref:HPr-rel-A system PqqD family peptide chaperone n=1 Tax=uncultured Sphingosinicella sp. TaxID=478748 RepID=UPI0030DD1E51|tara:strand:+ start:795 stop:1073 length:279 start_codon:yes stop_codon:yes gene_type:complete
MRYRAAARDAYVVRPVDDLTLVYHRPSGMTHVVSPAVVAILDLLHGRTLGIGEVCEQLAQHHDLDGEGDDIARVVTARLNEMAAMDIIDRIA